MTYEYSESQKSALRAHGLNDVADQVDPNGPGRLVEVKVPRDPTGRAPGVYSEFKIVGNASKRECWMGQFMDQPKLQVRINRTDVDHDTARKIIEEWQRDQAETAELAAHPERFRGELTGKAFNLRKIEG